MSRRITVRTLPVTVAVWCPSPRTNGAPSLSDGLRMADELALGPDSRREAEPDAEADIEAQKASLHEWTRAARKPIGRW